ncbi:glutaredoxin-domain-containing protein [Meredithblackwellia eburnea MCA 4105]
MLPSHHGSPDPDDDHRLKPKTARVSVLLQRIQQDPKLLLHYKPQLAGGFCAILLLFWLFSPGGGVEDTIIRWDGKAAQNWGDYVGLGLARAKILESTPAGYVDLSNKWAGGGGALFAARPRVGVVPPATIVEQEVGHSSSLQREASFDRDRHGVLGGASTEWSAGVVGMGTWLGERVDMRKDTPVEKEGMADPLTPLPARDALATHIIKRAWEYLDDEDRENTKKLLDEAKEEGSMEKLPLRDRVRGNEELSREAALGWSRIYGAMEGEWLKSALEISVEKLVRRSPLVVFSKSTCPHSKRAKELLRKYHLSPEPHIVEVDLRPDGANLKALLTRKTHHSTFPNIVLGGRSIGGADDLEALERESSSFRELLKDSGITVHGRS